MWWRWSESQQRRNTCWQTLHWCCSWSVASHLCSLHYKIFMCSMMERAATALDLHCGKLNSRYNGKPAEQEQPRHVSLQPSWSTGSQRNHLHHFDCRSNPAPSSQSQTHNHLGGFHSLGRAGPCSAAWGRRWECELRLEVRKSNNPEKFSQKNQSASRKSCLAFWKMVYHPICRLG